MNSLEGNISRVDSFVRNYIRIHAYVGNKYEFVPSWELLGSDTTTDGNDNDELASLQSLRAQRIFR